MREKAKKLLQNSELSDFYAMMADLGYDARVLCEIGEDLIDDMDSEALEQFVADWS